LITKNGAFVFRKNCPLSDQPWATGRAGAVHLIEERYPRIVGANVGTTPGRDRPARILVVDDDAPTRTLLRRLLSLEGYVIDEAANGPEAIDHLAREPVDLLLLDVMMPGQDGLELLAQVRRTSDVPVIMLTAKSDEADRVLGLRSGADDYVVKPFSAAELEARIAAVLRRGAHRLAAAPLDFGDLHIDIGGRQLTVNGVAVELPAREFELLVFLASSPGQVFSRETLMSEVWHSSPEQHDPGTVTEHARRLRQRIEDDPDRPRWIKTVRGIGYRFEA
jgi:two-component system, OmpR family, phosphate regulon response regulator PhoB